MTFRSLVALAVLTFACSGDTTPPLFERQPAPPNIAGDYELAVVDGVAMPAPSHPVNDCTGVYSTSEMTFRTNGTFEGRITEDYECPHSTFVSIARMDGTYEVRLDSTVLLDGSGTDGVDEAWVAVDTVNIVWRVDHTTPYDTLGFVPQ